MKGGHRLVWLDLMADGAHRVRSFGVEKSGVVAVHYLRGLPGWAEPQERPRTRRGMRSDSSCECEPTTTP